MNPWRGRARRDEDENDENTDGLDRPPPSPPKKDGAEFRVWCVEEWPDLLRLLCVLCELGVGDDRRRVYPADETVLDLPSNQPIVLVMLRQTDADDAEAGYGCGFSHTLGQTGE